MLEAKVAFPLRSISGKGRAMQVQPGDTFHVRDGACTSDNICVVAHRNDKQYLIARADMHTLFVSLNRADGARHNLTATDFMTEDQRALAETNENHLRDCLENDGNELFVQHATVAWNDEWADVCLERGVNEADLDNYVVDNADGSFDLYAPKATNDEPVIQNTLDNGQEGRYGVSIETNQAKGTKTMATTATHSIQVGDIFLHGEAHSPVVYRVTGLVGKATVVVTCHGVGRLRKDAFRLRVKETIYGVQLGDITVKKVSIREATQAMQYAVSTNACADRYFTYNTR